MKKALFPGTFDPFHEGHYEILIRAQKLFKKIIIFIGNNDAKKSSDFLTRYKQIKAFLHTLRTCSFCTAYIRISQTARADCMPLARLR